MTRNEMAEAWGFNSSEISQVTKDIRPTDYRWDGGKRAKGLYRPEEVAEILAEDVKNKRRRAQAAVTFYGDRLRRLAPYLGETEE